MLRFDNFVYHCCIFLSWCNRDFMCLRSRLSSCKVFEAASCLRECAPYMAIITLNRVKAHLRRIEWNKKNLSTMFDIVISFLQVQHHEPFLAYVYHRKCSNISFCVRLYQGWGTCGTREHLIWPASEFPLPKLEYNIASKRSSMME